MIGSFERSSRPVVLLALTLVGSLLTGCGSSGSDLSPVAAQGRDVVRSNGCTSCHGKDGSGGVGPPWVGLAGSTVQLDDGSTAIADNDYLRRSIVDPTAEITDGYVVTMPTKQLSESDIEAVIAYIGELK